MIFWLSGRVRADFFNFLGLGRFRALFFWFSGLPSANAWVDKGGGGSGERLTKHGGTDRVKKSIKLPYPEP